jgi:homogentisate 1,2-dioxygenase
MSVFRRGHIPRPPHGIDDNPDEIYTQGGFFGDWVHLFRRGNPGVPEAWSGDEVMYAGADLNALHPTDADDARGEPMPLLEGEGVRVLLSRRSESMPFAERNADHHQIRFYHRGEFVLDTELGRLEAHGGDFVVVGRGLAFRERPSTRDNVVLIFESEEPVATAEAMWEGVGFASMFVDYGRLTLPEPAGGAGGRTEVRVWSQGSWRWITYGFDPCSDVVGWQGKPVIYRLNVHDVPGIGTARGFLPPPAHAVLMTQSRSWFFNVLGMPPLPTQPAPEGSFGAPAHLNDYDEVWFNHASELGPKSVGHLWLFPHTVPHPGFKRAPGYPPNPVRRLEEIKINFDTRARLSWSDEARAAFLEGDVRRNVFLSLYGMPPEAVDVRLPKEEGR